MKQDLLPPIHCDAHSGYQQARANDGAEIEVYRHSLSLEMDFRWRRK